METEKQNNSSQPNQSGFMSQGINSINNLVRARRLFSGSAARLGSRLAIQTAGRGLIAFLVSNPWILGFVAIGILVIFVFVAVLSGAAPGAPSMPTAQTTPTTPIVAQTPTPTPLSAPE